MMTLFKPLAVEFLSFYDARITSALPKYGIFKHQNGLAYLDVNDDYIHQIYPTLAHSSVLKPDYFDEETQYIGAHISIIYPHELDEPKIETYLEKTFSFEIEGLICANIFNKKYYALKVHAPELRQIRVDLGLPGQLTFKEFLVDFHITVAVQELMNTL